uniref:VWFA domain-containing protein n=1 Tax=Leersia perrieri TaxID=77586 RepID=A0A0D9W2F6_9ORYZ
MACSNDKAPLEENTQKVLLELTDISSIVERSGLDLVAVVDISGSMGWDGKQDKLKTAMKFVISKLGPMDRLSIVSFNDQAKRLCNLRCMTQATKEDLMNKVENDLKDGGGTNMRVGLEKGLEVLASRRFRSNRVASVILMSDGQQTIGDARTVSIGDVAVYTFGFGADQDAKVLEAIAGKSWGGTFYNVKDGESLTVHFSALLAGVLSVVVQDLKLTLRAQRGHSEIQKVDAGRYTPDNNPSDITVSFGDLYSGEVRKVVVHLLLPAVHSEYSATVFIAQCTYSTQGTRFNSPPGGGLSCLIRRTRSASSSGAMKPEVKAELIRIDHVTRLKDARETGNIDSARDKLVLAKEALDIELFNLKLRLIDLLKAELEKLLLLSMTWKELCAGLLACIRSHECQRFGSIGDVNISIFRHTLIYVYVKQATEFEENPGRLPPSVEADVKAAEAELLVREADRHPRPRIWVGSPERRRSKWAWTMVLILCTALVIGVILASLSVFAVYLLYKPRMPYLAVSNAQLELLQYGQDGTIDYLQVSITIVAVNNNSKADASFSGFDLALGFHGAYVALLRAEPFVVARESSLPLQYNVVSAGRALDPTGKHLMDDSLKAGVVPFDLFGKARTKWKVGIFVKLRFRTRISCRLRFFFPGNGTVMPTDRDKCRSRSP